MGRLWKILKIILLLKITYIQMFDNNYYVKKIINILGAVPGRISDHNG